MMEGDESKIRVRFITKIPAIRVTETPFAVPLRLARHGLSQVINHLLGNDKPRPFDFLIGNQFLRTTLDKYITLNQISEENVLTLEYMDALEEPKLNTTKEHPDWISCISNLKDSSMFSTGCYDGNLRLLGMNGNILGCTQAHDGPIKALTSFKNMIVSGSKDHSVKSWIVDKEANSISLKKSFVGHMNSVESLSIDTTGKMMASGGWDNTIRLWSMDEDEKNVSHTIKKSKTSSSSSTLSQVESLTVLTGHTTCVSALAFDPTDSNRLISASWDRSLKVWDVEQQQCQQTIMARGCISSMSVSSEKGDLIATGHPDHVVRIWDLRADKIMVRSLSSHHQWVSAVAWEPQSSFRLLSASYDGCIKMWDLRSSIPLFTVDAHQGKVLDVTWLKQQLYATAGSDSKVNVYSCLNPHEESNVLVEKEN